MPKQKSLLLIAILSALANSAYAGWLDGALQQVIQETTKTAVQGVVQSAVGQNSQQQAPAPTQTSTWQEPQNTANLSFSTAPINDEKLKAIQGRHINSSQLLNGRDDNFAQLPNLIIGGFRVAFTTQAEASAHTRAAYLGGGTHSSGVSVSSKLHLQGVDTNTLQKLTDIAYQDFLNQLDTAGIKYLSYEEFISDPEFKEAKFAPRPNGFYAAEAGGRNFSTFAPTGLKLWFHQGESLGDVSNFGWGNQMLAGAVGYKNKAVVINPILVVDFARTSSSGVRNGFFNDKANADVSPTISLGGFDNAVYQTSLSTVIRRTPIRTTAVLGQNALKKPIEFAGNFGRIIETESSNNRGLVATMGLLGMSGGPVRHKSIQILQADSNAYQSIAMSALKTGNLIFIDKIQQSKLAKLDTHNYMPNIPDSSSTDNDDDNDPLDF